MTVLCAEKARDIISRMEYVQFGAVEDFLHLMVAATAIPHTDLQRYPSVAKTAGGETEET